MSTRGKRWSPPVRPPTGRKHVWINPRDLGYMSLGDYESCRDCGKVKNAHNVDAETCPGVVRVTLR